MRAIVPFQVPAVTLATRARPRDALTVAPNHSISAAPGGVATALATAVEQKKASR